MAKTNKTGFVNNAAICVGNDNPSNDYKGYGLILIANGGGVYRQHSTSADREQTKNLTSEAQDQTSTISDTALERTIDK